MNQEPKVCPICCEPVKPEARLCPHCRQWLSFRSLRNPAVAAALLGVQGLVIVVVLIIVGRSLVITMAYPKPHYTAFLDSIQVQESKMGWYDSSDGVRIS